MSQSAELSTLMTTPLPGARGHARSTAEAKNQRRLSATAQRLALAVMMVATFALGAAVMVATTPTADETGQPLEAPPGLGL